MIVGIDARSLKSRRGIGNVVFHLLNELSELCLDCFFIVYVDSEESLNLIPKGPRFSSKLLRPKLYPIWEQISLPLVAVRDNLDILHCPGNSGPIFLPQRIKLVLSIMDVMFMFPACELPTSPSLYQRLGRKYLKYVVPIVAKRATKITTISDSSRTDICQYIGLPAEHISVIWLAANSACSCTCDEIGINILRSKYRLNTPFIFALGAIDPRKNTEMILRSFAKYKLLCHTDIKLVLVGLSAQGIEKYTQVATKLGLVNEVILAGFVSEEDLVAFYNEAELFVYPSLYEGFGLPVLEAMQSGTPVISSPSGSIPEITGDACIMVDPYDADAISKAIKNVLTEKDLYETLVKKGKRRAELFSWKTAAIKTFAVYHAAMTEK